MKPRAVRVPMADALVRFNGRAASLVNISRSGALIRLYDPIVIGTEGRLTLSQRSTTIEINGRVVREIDPKSAGEAESDGRQVGISFIDVPPPEITALLRRLIAQG